MRSNKYNKNYGPQTVDTRKKAIGAATNFAVKLLHSGFEVKMWCWYPGYVRVMWWDSCVNSLNFDRVYNFQKEK